MRITNKIMQRNSLGNINRNKELQDTLTTQMATEKKISRPSDDPVVAIRALRLRTNVTEITQYYSKNIPDADSWLKVTEDALNNLSTIVTEMSTQCTKGANGDLTTSDRQIILEQLKALADEVYTTGDADYAGRYVFTGYRTDTSLSFQNKTERQYTITQQLTNASIDSIKYVNTDDMLSWTTANYDSTLSGLTENDISEATVNRIRLAYKDTNVGTNADGSAFAPTIEYTDGAGATQTISMTNIVDSTDKVGGKDPYSYVADNDDAVVFVKDTG